MQIIENEDFIIEIQHDHFYNNPREDADGYLFNILTRRAFTTGDNFIDINNDDIFDNHIDSKNISLKQEFLDKHYAKIIYYYSHSDFTISTTPFNCKYDSGIYGIICCEKDKAESDFNGDFTKEKIYEILELEVNELKDYLEGNVYAAIGYLKCPHCGSKTDNLFSIGNYYPNMKDCFVNAMNEEIESNGFNYKIKEEDITYF